MKTVIIEGTDNVGKDTIINRLTEEFKHNVVIHCEKPENDTPWNQSLKQENTFAKLLGENIYYDLNKEASDYMDVNIETLLKLERIIK